MADERTMTSEQMSGEHDLHDAENDAQAARLRVAGLSYREIAQRQGCSLSTAHTRVKRALAAVPADAVKELRQLEEARLDDMWKIAWAEATRNRDLIQNGRVVMTMGPENKPVPMIDYGAKLAALDRLLRIHRERKLLHGLDEPTRTRIEVVTEDVIDAEIRRLEEEIAEREAAAREG